MSGMLSNVSGDIGKRSLGIDVGQLRRDDQAVHGVGAP